MKITGIVMLLNKYCIYACVYCISKAPLFEKLSLKKGLPEFYDKNIKKLQIEFCGMGTFPPKPLFFGGHLYSQLYVILKSI